MTFSITDKILLIGRSGCGKSWLGKMIQKVYPRRIIFDTTEEYTDDRFTYVHSWNEFSNFLIANHDSKKFVLVVRFNTEDEDLNEVTFNEMMKAIYRFGNVMVVIEEVQDYCSPHYIGFWFKKCMTSGRHRSLSFIFTTQRPSIINGNIFSQSTHIFTGNLIKKSDASAMADLLNMDRKEFNVLEDRKFFWFYIYRNPKTIKISSNEINIS